MPGSKGDGNGYIAQVKEMELLRRDNVRMVGELSQRDSHIDHLRNELNHVGGTVRELQALAAHQVRTAFAMGAGAGVVIAMAAWGVVALVLR